MTTIRPFRGLRPSPSMAAQIIAPPYDTVDEAEARAIVAEHPRSFLHVTRAEVDLPEGSDPHSPAAYAKARENLDAYIQQGWLLQDDTPCLYLYAQTWQGRTQSGLMAVCDTRDYVQNTIKKHELTRPDKEQDRVDHIEGLDAQSGLVFLTFRDQSDAVRDALAQARALPVDWQATTDDGVTHALTIISDEALIGRLVDAFGGLDALYIADGHHRSAAAARVAQARGESGSSRWFLAGIFPDSELKIMAYNRLVADLNGHSVEALHDAIGQHFHITSGVAPEPTRRGELTMYLGGLWHALTPRAGVVDTSDPVRSLDVSVLQDRVLAPLLGIANPRTDERIRFVGGIRGHQALQAAVDSGKAQVAFHLYPTGLDQLLAVADADQLMPPESTWFEPKLRGGVLLHRIAD